VSSSHEIRAYFTAAVPQFPVPDVVQTAEYYRDVLGFHVAGDWDGERVHQDPTRPAVFGIVERDVVRDCNGLILAFGEAVRGRISPPSRPGPARGISRTPSPPREGQSGPPTAPPRPPLRLEDRASGQERQRSVGPQCREALAPDVPGGIRHGPSAPRGALSETRPSEARRPGPPPDSPVPPRRPALAAADRPVPA